MAFCKYSRETHRDYRRSLTRENKGLSTLHNSSYKKNDYAGSGNTQLQYVQLKTIPGGQANITLQPTTPPLIDSCSVLLKTDPKFEILFNILIRF